MFHHNQLKYRKKLIIISAGQRINTLTQSWCTPQKYVDTINKFFNNQIELDPCSNEDSILITTNKYILPQDGLIEDWNYKTIYCNPPYGIDKERHTTIKSWIKKCYESHIEYQSEIIALIPVATNTRHWKDYIFDKASAICFLADTRLKFRIDGNEENKGSPMACAMIYWGYNYEKFDEVFSEFGYVVIL